MKKAEDYGEGYVTADRRPEHRVRMLVDADGYVVSGRIIDDDDGFMAFMRSTRAPIDPADVVLPEGYHLDADGRAVKDVHNESGELLARITTELEPTRSTA